MKLSPKIVKTTLLKGSGICLVIILNLLMALSIQAQERVAYVNEARLRQEYKQLIVFQNEFVESLQRADMEYTRKSREIDSLYQEKVFASEQSALSAVNRDHDRAMKKMHEEHMQNIEELRTQYAGQVSRCDDLILKAIVNATKEAGYDKWVPLEGEKSQEEGADITAQVLIRLNQ